MIQQRKLNDAACFMAFPSYDNWYSGGAMRAGEWATKQFALRKEQYNSSLITKCFNVLWVRAVMSQCRYWAMVHADINPPGYWLDTMIGTMRRKGGTFLSACVSIKDDSGRISCAMCGEGEPHYILTESDLVKLPAVFTGYDVNKTLGINGDLLVNTGLWVADMSADWVYKVWFELKSGISWDNYKQAHVSQESEDWLLSKMLHKLGVTVWATQEMRIGHLGQKEWVCGGKSE
jgi:hypothetical protein